MFFNIYNTLNLVRMYNQDSLYNLAGILNCNFFDDLDIKKNIYKYLWEVKRLSLYCLDNNIIYSIHLSSNINYDKLEELEKMRIIVVDDLLKILNKLKKMIK